MNIQQLYEFCLSKKGVTEHFPFDEDTLVFKVGGKVFCISSLQDWEKGCPSVVIKCEPEKALELRASFEAVQPGYHSNKKHWNSVFINRDATDVLVFEWIQDSYDLVYKSLPVKLKNDLK